MAISHLFRRSTQTIASLVLALAVIAFLFVFIAQATGRYRFVPVLSGSMSPWVETGDVAVLEPRPADDLAVGDVIAFEAPVDGAPLTLHRVVEIVSPAPELAIRTQGDANSAPDPWTAQLPDEELWRATSHIDDLGAPVVLLNQAKTRFLLVAFAALLFGWWGMSLIWRDGGDDDAPSVDSSAPLTSSAGSALVRRAGVPLAVVVMALLVGTNVLGGRGAAATFNDRAAGTQLVSSGAFDRLTLSADLACSPKADSASVLLSWTPASVPVAGYEVYRGTVSGGPYDTVAGSVAGDVLTFEDPLEKIGGIPLYYVVRTADPAVTVEESNEAFALIVCELPPVTVVDTKTTTTTTTTTTVPLPLEPLLTELSAGLG